MYRYYNNSIGTGKPTTKLTDNGHVHCIEWIMDITVSVSDEKKFGNVCKEQISDDEIVNCYLYRLTGVSYS